MVSIFYIATRIPCLLSEVLQVYMEELELSCNCFTGSAMTSIAMITSIYNTTF